MSLSITNKLIELLFPRCCPVCGDIVLPKGNLICKECFKKLCFIKQPACRKCGKEVLAESAEYCFDCTRHKRSFDYGIALLNYGKVEKESMIKIKYKNKREYLDFYAEAISIRYQKILLRMNAEALIPIPVHPSRKRQRGFNQAEILADQISLRLGIPVWKETLLRNKKTEPQKKLDAVQRLKNLEQAFVVQQDLKQVQSVILVDDIYTTGSTMEACTRALKAAGVKHVYYITICIGRGQ